jgi:flagellar hook assembly protein FlgD
MAFDIVGREDWTLTVYNIAGQTVREFSGRDASGHVTVAWDGRDNSGRSVASGMYFYRLQAGQFTDSKKMTLVK